MTPYDRAEAHYLLLESLLAELDMQIGIKLRVLDLLVIELDTATPDRRDVIIDQYADYASDLSDLTSRAIALKNETNEAFKRLLAACK